MRSVQAAAKTNMSDLPFATLAQNLGFAPDPRFFGTLAEPDDAEPEDPVALAYARGFAEGSASTSAAAEASLTEALAARGAIELAIVRHNAELEEHWRDRLENTVEVLCNAALAPLAIDPAALTSRIARAAALLSRADDERLLRLHPDDLVLVEQALPPGLPVAPDPALPRGTVRIESAQGGVEDGPEAWRAALAEALSQC